MLANWPGSRNLDRSLAAIIAGLALKRSEARYDSIRGGPHPGVTGGGR